MNEDIKELIAEFKLDKPNRKRDIVYKRYYLMHILHCRSRLCLREIGEMFNRDHSSVIHALKEHERWWSQLVVQTKAGRYRRRTRDHRTETRCFC